MSAGVIHGLGVALLAASGALSVSIMVSTIRDNLPAILRVIEDMQR